MKEIVANGRLYDFYGELLTEHQKKVYEDAVYNDMTLNELADSYGISRQAAHDLIKRCTKTMQGYEDRLHMIRRFQAIRSETKRLKDLGEEAESVRVTKKQLMGVVRRIEEALD